MWRKVTWLSSASTSEFTSTRQWPGRAGAWPGFAVGVCLAVEKLNVRVALLNGLR